MNKIIKALEEKGIKYIVDKKGNIIIELEKNCIWINGYNEEMKYNKQVSIHKDTYKNYIMGETTGYNLSKTIAKSTKQDNIINAINERFL